MQDYGIDIHSFTNHLKVSIVNDQLDLKDFKTDIRVSWAHSFEFTKRRFDKLYLDSVFSLCKSSYYTSVIVEYGDYDYILYFKVSEI